MQTYWNGEPTECRQVWVIVADSGFFPVYWAKNLVGQRVPAVEVDYGGQKNYLYDGDGSAWRKVTEGMGSPRIGHKDLDIKEGSVSIRW